VSGHPNPCTDALVRETMQGVRRALGVAPTQKKGITTGDIKAAVSGLPPGLAGHRDRLLLTLGFAGGFRRSELAGITVADAEQLAEGLLVHLERSKTDQEGKGRRVEIVYGTDAATCPGPPAGGGRSFDRLPIRSARVLAPGRSDLWRIVVAERGTEAPQLPGAPGERSAGDELAGGVGDVGGVESRRRQQLVGLARGGHLPHRELDDAGVVVGVGKGVEDGVTEPALRPVVLDGDHLVARGSSGLAQTGGVDGLDRVAVEHPYREAFARQCLGCFQRLVQGDAGRGASAAGGLQSTVATRNAADPQAGSMMRRSRSAASRACRSVPTAWRRSSMSGSRLRSSVRDTSAGGV